MKPRTHSFSPVSIYNARARVCVCLLQTLSAVSVGKMSCDMTSSVTHLHRCDIVHRDIAARNFL